MAQRPFSSPVNILGKFPFPRAPHTPLINDQTLLKFHWHLLLKCQFLVSVCSLFSYIWHAEGNTGNSLQLCDTSENHVASRVVPYLSSDKWGTAKMSQRHTHPAFVRLFCFLHRETWNWSRDRCTLCGPSNLIRQQQALPSVHQYRYENRSSIPSDKCFCHESNIMKCGWQQVWEVTWGLSR